MQALKTIILMTALLLTLLKRAPERRDTPGRQKFGKGEALGD
jgi:hypothetical protein